MPIECRFLTMEEIFPGPTRWRGFCLASKVPTLMVTGRYDTVFPAELALGTYIPQARNFGKGQVLGHSSHRSWRAGGAQPTGPPKICTGSIDTSEGYKARREQGVRQILPDSEHCGPALRLF
jgi:hypothetical protein